MQQELRMKVHFIGIGGVGMSALARIMRAKGHEVTGSDAKEGPVTNDLKKLGIGICIGHRRENIHEDQVVVYSTAIKKDNPEWIAAQNNQCMHRSELLEQILSEKEALLVVGAHGKTTTSSLLSYVFEVAGGDPSFVIGGFSPSLGGVNGKFGKGPFFIAEGDESDGSFLRADPIGAIITNVDFDHLYYWGSEEALLSAYQQFIKGVKRRDLLFYLFEDRHMSKWNMDGISFGLNAGADLRASNICYVNGKQHFTAHFQGRVFEDIEISLLGVHNVLNSLACFGLAFLLGISEVDIRKAFSTFKGVKRRLEWKGRFNGADLYDDYAHHPEEIKATLAALAEGFQGKRKVAIFQPHRFTRLRDLMSEFSHKDVWENCDELIVTDIYSAGETPIPGITINAFLEKLSKKATYVPRDLIGEFLFDQDLQNSVVITLGAGDITNLADEITLMSALSSERP